MTATQYLYVAGGHIRDAIAALRDWSRTIVGGKSATLSGAQLSEGIEPFLELKKQLRLLQREIDKGLPEGVERWIIVDSRSDGLTADFHRKAVRLWRCNNSENYFPLKIDGDYTDDEDRTPQHPDFDSSTACWRHVDRESRDSVHRQRSELIEDVYRLLGFTMADTEAWKNVMLLVRV